MPTRVGLFSKFLVELEEANGSSIIRQDIASNPQYTHAPAPGIAGHFQFCFSPFFDASTVSTKWHLTSSAPTLQDPAGFFRTFNSHTSSLCVAYSIDWIDYRTSAEQHGAACVYGWEARIIPADMTSNDQIADMPDIIVNRLVALHYTYPDVKAFAGNNFYVSPAYQLIALGPAWTVSRQDYRAAANYRELSALDGGTSMLYGNWSMYGETTIYDARTLSYPILKPYVYLRTAP
jgi:hypothetical protein